MRPTLALVLFLLLLVAVDLVLYRQAQARRAGWQQTQAMSGLVVAGLGLSDLCLATEARYTRHPAVSDPVVPFMDHPGALEHFPSGSFWAWPGTARPRGWS